MLKFIKQSNWFTGILIFFMPVTLIIFLGSQMAYSQVKGKFEAYQNIPEITTLAELETMPADQLVMLRGRISEATPLHNGMLAPDLIIYQERPANGREVRYQEEFPLIFPEFVLDLPDGTLTIIPSSTREHVIQNELHTVTDGDRQYTGFVIGDVVTVQGQWQSFALNEVTGITSVHKQDLMSEWEVAFQKVGWVRDGSGLLTLLSIILLVLQLRRARASEKETEEWQTPTTKTAPIT